MLCFFISFAGTFEKQFKDFQTIFKTLIFTNSKGTKICRRNKTSEDPTTSKKLEGPCPLLPPSATTPLSVSLDNFALNGWLTLACRLHRAIFHLSPSNSDVQIQDWIGWDLMIGWDPCIWILYIWCTEASNVF